MAVIPVQTGSNMPLFMQLGDRDTGMYVRARIYDSTSTEITGSPVALTHIASGLYLNYSLAKPAGPFLLVQIAAYTDASYNTLASYDTKTDMIVQDVVGAKADPPTLEEIVNGMWDESLADHLDTGSTGAKLNYLQNGCPDYVDESFVISMPRDASEGSMRALATDVNIALRQIQTVLNKICEE